MNNGTQVKLLWVSPGVLSEDNFDLVTNANVPDSAIELTGIQTITANEVIV